MYLQHNFIFFTKMILLAASVNNIIHKYNIYIQIEHKYY